MNRVLVFNDFGGPEQMQVVDRSVPDPGPGEIAVKVEAAAVNPVDWKIREGLLGRHGPLPMPMGREAAGVVTAVGAGVADFTVGDAVLGLAAPGHGTFAQHTVLSADKTVAKPEEISFADAATLPVAGATAYDATHQIELDAGQTLVVIGAGGGVGRMAVQIGKVHQFTVVGVASAAKKDLVESAGAVFVESGDGLSDRIRAAVPTGADLVVDTVGGDALRAVAPVAKDPSLLVSTADRDTVVELGGAAVKRTDEGLAKITGVVQYALVDPTVTSRFPLEDAIRAVAEVEAGHATGKVVIEP